MAGAGQGQGQSDNSMGAVWIIVAVFAAVLLSWFLWHTQIVAFVLKIKLYEALLMSLFTSGLDSLILGIRTVDPSTVTVNQLGAVCDQIGKYYRIPFIAILGYMAFVLINTSSISKFKNTFSMKKLHQQEKDNWPQITPVCNIDLANESIEEGEWAMSMTPMNYGKKHKLIRVEEKQPEPGQLAKRVTLVPKVIKHKANQVFVNQLGAPWRGHKHLPIHARALMGVFAAKAMEDRDSAEKLLMQIARSSASGKLNFTGADELLEKHINSKIVQKVISGHAYEGTVMASMLELARTDGVLASAEFLWLKPLDRRLWYILNTVGRRTAPIEVAGVFSHWAAEKAIGRRLTIPMVEEATKAMQLALDEIIYQPEDTQPESD